MGCSHFARRYFGNRCCFLFLRVLRCFSSPRLPLSPMYSAIDKSELPEMGFPIQKSSAQCLFSGSPKLIAANHVFHRHPTPRHPPSALYSLAINFFHLYYFYRVFKAPLKLHYPVFSCQRTNGHMPRARYSKLKAEGSLRKTEPSAFSSQLSNGGGERDRTDDFPAWKAGCSLPSSPL